MALIFFPAFYIWWYSILALNLLVWVFSWNLLKMTKKWLRRSIFPYVTLSQCGWEIVMLWHLHLRGSITFSMQGCQKKVHPARSDATWIFIHCHNRTCWDWTFLLSLSVSKSKRERFYERSNVDSKLKKKSLGHWNWVTLLLLASVS